MLQGLNKQFHNLAARIVSAAGLNHQTLSGFFLRKLMNFHQMTRAVLLYQAGFIKKAKAITDSKRYSSALMRPVIKRINETDLALNDWKRFVQQVEMPGPVCAPGIFNGHVLMAVNSVAKFDSNGYSVRSTQIRDALNDVSIQAEFCARFAYPWDMAGKGKLPFCERVSSDEGRVWLRYDPSENKVYTDTEYWKVYANYIEDLISQLSSKPTILHAHSKYHNGIAAALAGRTLGIPVVYEMRGLWHLTRAQAEQSFANSDYFAYEQRLEVWAAELANAVVVISEGLKSWLVQRGISDLKIVVIPNAPPPGLLAAPCAPRVNSGTMKLAFMGSLTAYEGLGTVIEAVSLLLAQGVSVSFDIFGSGPQRAVLERQVRKLKLATHVRFRGQMSRPDIQDLVTDFDIYPVIRNDSEVTRLIPPLKHLEPMAAGRVILVSALPALLEEVPECVAQHAVPPEDSHTLAQKLLDLWNSPDAMTRIGADSRLWVAEHRNWTQNGRRYKELYESLAQLEAHEKNTVVD